MLERRVVAARLRLSSRRFERRDLSFDLAHALGRHEVRVRADRTLWKVARVVGSLTKARLIDVLRRRRSPGRGDIDIRTPALSI
jgi:hypothetical protein